MIYGSYSAGDNSFGFINVEYATTPSDIGSTIEVFNKLNEEGVKDILLDDTILVEEVELFKALLNWANHQCSNCNNKNKAKNGNDYDAKDFTNLYKLIRYPLMSLKDFAEIVLPTKILTIEEEHKIFHYVSLTTSNSITK